MKGLGDGGEMGEETASTEDISLGSIDAFRVNPTADWLQGLDQVLLACSQEEVKAEDIKRFAMYLFERGWVPVAVPNTFNEPEVSSGLT